jgi:hypothetical protein
MPLRFGLDNVPAGSVHEASGHCVACPSVNPDGRIELVDDEAADQVGGRPHRDSTCGIAIAAGLDGVSASFPTASVFRLEPGCE